jgi:hypothetical protein
LPLPANGEWEFAHAAPGSRVIIVTPGAAYAIVAALPANAFLWGAVMTIRSNMRAAAFAVALSFVPASAGLADECDDMRKGMSDLYDKINYKPDLPAAKRCALMGEAYALLQASRQVFSECLEDSERLKKLVAGDRVIRELYTDMIKTCL